jgi:Ca2+-binding RTX toxin-like protein
MSPVFCVTEALESRTLLSSAVVSQGVLHVTGDLNTANTITVRRTSDTEITVSIAGKSDQVFGACDLITKVLIDGGDKADRLAIDESAMALGLPVEINGLGDNDTIVGSAGDDTLNGQGGNDSIVGNAGNDRIFGREGNDFLEGGAGSDMLKGGGGNDILHGGLGNDSLWGNKGGDSVSGDDGNDVMYGGAAGDTMLGGNGNDVFHGGDPRDQMDGGTGRNRFLKH